MVATQPRPKVGSPPKGFSPPEDNVVWPRRGLPGSRAVVGALLVAVAAVGTFAAWSASNHRPSSRYVVATHAVAAGTVLGADDIKTVAIDLPGAQASRSFSDVGALVHGVTLGPLETGELVQSGNVLPPHGAKPRPEFSFGIDAERAVAGSLRSGDRIDILVTYGTGAGSVTQLVSPHAYVLSVDGGVRNGLSDARRQVLTVALAESDDILALTNAVRAGEISVARSSGVQRRPSSRTYQPRVPAEASGSTSTPRTNTSAPTRRNP